MAERWWSTPMEGESGRTVMVTGRDNLDKQRDSGKFPYLVRVSWDYNALPDGMPDESDAELMGRVAEALETGFRKDKVAYITAIITGEGKRDWLFYTGNLNIFGKVFNRSLETVPETVPFVIEAESDPQWSAYLDIRSQTYISPDPEE